MCWCSSAAPTRCLRPLTRSASLSVEIGAHYFSQVLDLQDHLDKAQLRKFGFRFFFSEGRRDIDQVTEIGASRFLAVPSYQLDRGIFEKLLGAEARRRGVRFVDARRRPPDRTLGRPSTPPPELRDRGGKPGGSARAGSSMHPVGPGCSNASWASRSRTRTTRTPSGFASRGASTSITGPTTKPGASAATLRPAGSRPTTW
jgi:hypothetical protein